MKAHLLAGALWLGLLVNVPAGACLCSSEATAAAAAENADAVFTGRVRSASYHLMGPVTVVRLDVRQSWKGVTEPTVWILTGYSPSHCGFVMAPNRDYLIYAEQIPSELDYAWAEPGTYLTTDACTRSELVVEARADFEALGRPRRSWSIAADSGSSYLEYDFDFHSRGIAFDTGFEVDRTTAHSRDVLGQPLLALACLTDDVAMIDEILRAGADPNALGPHGGTALMIAAMSGNPAAVRLLVEAGARVDAALPERAAPELAGATALAIAARKGYHEIVAYLAANGAGVDGHPKAARTPLMRAVVGRSPETVATLLRLGARVAAADPKGQTALELAKRERAPSRETRAIVEMLEAASR